MRLKLVTSILLITLGLFLFLYVQQSQMSTEVKEEKIRSFSSPEEFREYLSKSEAYVYPFAFGISAPEPVPKQTLPETPALGKIPEVERVSQTNVQVPGIDEPDIVKTDGKNIYVSRYQRVLSVEKILPIRQSISVVKAYPPEELEKVKELNVGGEILVYEKTLIVLSGNRIRAFSAEDFSERYSMSFNGSIVATRLYDGKIYLVISQHSELCPIPLLSANGVSLSVECNRIYYPKKPLPAEVVYTILKIDAVSGRVEDTVSFVGNYASIVYMSRNAVYVAHYSPAEYAEVFFKFVSENRDLFPDWFFERIQKLLSYDLSNQARQVEIWNLMRRMELTMKPEEKILFENEFRNRYEKFVEKHKRDFEKTVIWKISREMKIVATGEVPGRLLNQFSMDEYNGFLRVAVTVGNENDLYVMDSDLRVVGSLLGFGKAEVIYGVRFVADKGYVVTFRQVDPFFVVDLSNPEKPRMAGELKIPGYSSYLHPLGGNLILGVGMEGESVKISLFDVSDPGNPVEVDRYLLKESWSEVISNHRAFLVDEKHGIFFIPAKNGYIFSYKDGLRLIRVTETGFRAVFINDYLYVIGSKILAFDERTWEKVAEIEL